MVVYTKFGRKQEAFFLTIARHREGGLEYKWLPRGLRARMRSEGALLLLSSRGYGGYVGANEILFFVKLSVRVVFVDGASAFSTSRIVWRGAGEKGVAAKERRVGRAHCGF